MSKYFGTNGFYGKEGITLIKNHAYKECYFFSWYYNVLRKHNGYHNQARIVIDKVPHRSSYTFEYSLVAGLTESDTDDYLLHIYQLVCC